MATLARPDGINRKAKIESRDYADAALHEMAWLNHERASIEAKAQKRIDAIKTETKGLLVVDVDGRDVPIDDRLALLESNVLEWCGANLDQYLKGKEKSLKLPHGKLVKRKLLDAIAFSGVKDEAEVLDRINQRVPLLDKMNRILAQMLGVFRLGAILKLTATLNKPAIKAAWENQPDDRAALTELGLTLKVGEERTSVEPSEYQISVAN